MKGYKYCKCGEQVPARLKICNLCDYEFQEGDSFEAPQEEMSDEVKQYLQYCIKFNKAKNEQFVHIPAGRCPVPFDDKDIEGWIYDIIQYGKKIRILYSPDAIKYWIKDIHGYRTEMYFVCVATLHRMINE